MDIDSTQVAGTSVVWSGDPGLGWRSHLVISYQELCYQELCYQELCYQETGNVVRPL